MFTLYQCTTGPTICPPSIGCPQPQGGTIGPTAWLHCQTGMLGCPTSPHTCFGGKTTTLDCNNQGGAQAQTINFPTNGCIKTISVQCAVTAIVGCGQAAQAQTIMPPSILCPTVSSPCVTATANTGGGAQAQTISFPTNGCIKTISVQCAVTAIAGCHQAAQAQTIIPPSILCPTVSVCPTVTVGGGGAQAQTISFPTNGCIKTISVQCATTAVPTNGCIPTVSVDCVTRALNCGGAKAQTVFPTITIGNFCMTQVCHTAANAGGGAQAQTIHFPTNGCIPTIAVECIPTNGCVPTVSTDCLTKALNCNGAQAQTITSFPIPTNGCIKTISVQCATKHIPTNGCIPTISANCATQILGCGGAQAQTIGMTGWQGCTSLLGCTGVTASPQGDGAHAQTLAVTTTVQTNFPGCTGVTTPPQGGGAQTIGVTGWQGCTNVLGCTGVTASPQGGAQAQTIPTLILCPIVVTAIAHCNGAQAQTIGITGWQGCTSVLGCTGVTTPPHGGQGTIGVTGWQGCTSVLGCTGVTASPKGDGAQAQTIPTFILCATAIINHTGAQAQTIGVTAWQGCPTSLLGCTTVTTPPHGGGGAQAQTLGVTAWQGCPTSLFGCTTATTPPHGGGGAQAQTIPTLLLCPNTINTVCLVTKIAGC